MKKQFLLGTIFFTLFMIFPDSKSKSFSLGPVHIGGWAGEKLDGLGGLAGKPMELLTAGTIKDLHDKLDDNITHLDSIMAKNARHFTNNLDSVLKIREDQLHDVLNDNLITLRTGLNENIDNLQTTIDQGLNGVEKITHNTGEQTWRAIKLIAYLSLIVLTVSFIFLSFKESQGTGKINAQVLKNVFKRVQFYLIGLVIAIIAIYIFQPPTGKYKDKAWDETVKKQEILLRNATKSWDFATSIVKATALSYLRDDAASEYGLYKVLIWKNLFILRAGGTLKKEERIDEEFANLTSFYNSSKINDPQFFIISALYKQQLLNSKEGNLLAALDCFKYIETKEKKYNTLYDLDLEPYCYDVIKLYFLNPYDTSTVRQKLTTRKEIFTDKELQMFYGDYDYTESVANYPELYIKQLAYEELQFDAQKLYRKLFSDGDDTKESEKRDKDQIINHWLANLNYIKSMPNLRYVSEKALIWNDFLAQNILGSYSNKRLDSLKNDMMSQELKANTTVNDSIINAAKNIFVFKKQILWWRLGDKIDTLAKGMTIVAAAMEVEHFYSMLDNFVKICQSGFMADELSNVRYKIKVSCELNLYYKPKYSMQRPLAYEIIESSEKSLINQTKNQKVAADLKTYADSILEQHFYKY